MPTSLSYPAKVHSASRGLVSVSAVVAGANTAAMVDGLKVEVVADDPQQGSLTINFYGADLAQAIELFKPGGEIRVTFEPGEVKK